MNVAVAILRLQDGLDCTVILADVDDLIPSKSSGKRSELCDSPAKGRSHSVIISNSESSPTSIINPLRSNSGLSNHIF
jgi:solute carrier family 12 sodium/potassium/chloride transporter 2